MQIDLCNIQVAKVEVVPAVGLRKIFSYRLESFERFQVAALQEHQIGLVISRLHEQFVHVQSLADLFGNVVHLFGIPQLIGECKAIGEIQVGHREGRPVLELLEEGSSFGMVLHRNLVLFAPITKVTDICIDLRQT